MAECKPWEHDWYRHTAEDGSQTTGRCRTCEKESPMSVLGTGRVWAPKQPTSYPASWDMVTDDWPWQPGPSPTVKLDGEPVTKVTAWDVTEGKVRRWCTDPDGNAYVDPECLDTLAEEVLEGEVRIEWPEPAESVA